jgi:hypothetical protein
MGTIIFMDWTVRARHTVELRSYGARGRLVRYFSYLWTY